MMKQKLYFLCFAENQDVLNGVLNSYEKNKNTKDKNTLIDEIRRIIRSSTGNRAKESLIIDFINQTDLDEIQDKVTVNSHNT